jgi:ABC-type molybdate transport system substrate-binding protein
VIADLRKRIQEGETADVMILSRAALDDLQGQGKVVSGSIVNLASSYVAIAVRAGAAKPDIGSADALKRTLLAARSIVYADPAKGGASGVYFAKVLDRLGIADQMKSRTILAPSAQAAEIVAKGEAKMGVAQASEIVIHAKLTRHGKERPGVPSGDRAKRAKGPSASFFATPSSGTGDALILVRRRISMRRIGPRNLERAA